MANTLKLNDMTLFAALNAEVKIDGEWLPIEECAAAGIELVDAERSCDGYFWKRLTLTNRTGRELRLGGFRWRQTGAHTDFLGTPGKRLRLYKGGWMMASACGSVRYGDTDFELDPGYKKFAVSAPDEYDNQHPNRFFADNVIVLNDSVTGNSLLAGFISSADLFGRFLAELDEQGVCSFSMINDADDRIVSPAESVNSEELVLLFGPDGYGLLEKFADLWGDRMKARRPSGRVPTGWCSWYYYFSNVTEADILENARYLAAHRDEYPLEYLQLDDGYQSALGDWLICNEKFPHGLAYLAGEIRKAGFKPAIWFGPFMVETKSELFRRHPDWMIQDENGNPCLAFEWRGKSPVAVLDGTNPAVQEHFRTLFAEVRRMGFEYVKLDFMMLASSVRNGVLFDRKATRAQALRRGLAAIREGFGDDGFILGCTIPLGPAVGLVDGERIATDITPYWKPDRKYYAEAPTVPNVCRNIINRCYMNHRLWISDPDTHIARIDNNKLTQNEVELWSCAVRLAGGMLLLSDRFETLAPERARFSRWLLSDPDAYETRPLDFFEHTTPTIWFGTHRRTGERVLGFFNFEDVPQILSVDLGKLSDTPVKLVDVLDGEVLGEFSGVFTINVLEHSCRLLRLA